MSPTPSRRPEPKGKMKTGKCENHNYTDPNTDETGDCPKCASGEKIRVEVKRPSDFCCPVCGERLTPIQEGFPKWIWVAGGAVVAAIIITVICLAMGGKAEEEKTVDKPTIVTGTVTDTATSAPEEEVTEPAKVENPVVVNGKAPEKEKPQTEPTQASGSHKLSYGTWKGGWKNGKPHGNGTMTYSVATIIDERDSKKREAQPGEYVIGEWDNGHLVQGRWFKNDGSKEAVIIGKVG